MSYDLRQNLPFIGYSTYQIVANYNLPTVKQVLAVLFYNLRKLSNSLDMSAKLVIEECVIFYKKNNIPTQETHKCVEKLKTEYQKWRKITKNSKRKSETQQKNEAEYEKSINKLFDIAKSNAIEVIENENDKRFLHEQRGEYCFLTFCNQYLFKQENCKYLCFVVRMIILNNLITDNFFSELPRIEDIHFSTSIVGADPENPCPMELEEENLDTVGSEFSTSSINKEMDRTPRKLPICNVSDDIERKGPLINIIYDHHHNLRKKPL